MCQPSRGEDRQGDNEKYAEVLHYCTTSEAEGSEECRFPLSSVIFIDKQISVERQPLQCRINAEQLACDACSTRILRLCARAEFCK